jgi:hypothetical protein
MPRKGQCSLDRPCQRIVRCRLSSHERCVHEASSRPQLRRCNRPEVGRLQHHSEPYTCSFREFTLSETRAEIGSSPKRRRLGDCLGSMITVSFVPAPQDTRSRSPAARSTVSFPALVPVVLSARLAPLHGSPAWHTGWHRRALWCRRRSNLPSSMLEIAWCQDITQLGEL